MSSDGNALGDAAQALPHAALAPFLNKRVPEVIWLCQLEAMDTQRQTLTRVEHFGSKFKEVCACLCLLPVPVPVPVCVSRCNRIGSWQRSFVSFHRLLHRRTRRQRMHLLASDYQSHVLFIVLSFS